MVSYSSLVRLVRSVLRVLILIVVDNGLVPTLRKKSVDELVSLNPYCSGQWSRTRGTGVVWLEGMTS